MNENEAATEHNLFCFASRAEYDLFQIELSKNYGMTDWRDDVKRVLMKAGLENSPVVFLFCDTQVFIFFSHEQLDNQP